MSSFDFVYGVVEDESGHFCSRFWEAQVSTAEHCVRGGNSIIILFCIIVETYYNKVDLSEKVIAENLVECCAWMDEQ